MRGELAELLRVLALLWASAVGVAATLDLLRLVTDGGGITAALLRSVGSAGVLADPGLYLGAWVALCLLVLFAPLYLLLALASRVSEPGAP